MEITITYEDRLADAAREFVKAMGDNTVFALWGQMGAGKTTFVKAVCKELGVQDIVNSPTFAIVNEYVTNIGSPVYHFDFYRIRNIGEALDIGCQDYFHSGNLCFIEWPEMVEPLLPEDTVKVSIDTLPDGSRRLTM